MKDPNQMVTWMMIYYIQLCQCIRQCTSKFVKRLISRCTRYRITAIMSLNSYDQRETTFSIFQNSHLAATEWYLALSCVLLSWFFLQRKQRDIFFWLKTTLCWYSLSNYCTLKWRQDKTRQDRAGRVGTQRGELLVIKTLYTEHKPPNNIYIYIYAHTYICV